MKEIRPKETRTRTVLTDTIAITASGSLCHPLVPEKERQENPQIQKICNKKQGRVNQNNFLREEK